jgi:hypothetical protein
MISNNRNRRWAGGVAMTAGAAFGAALIGLAPAARADTPEPFQDLFGDAGINTWTPSADAYLDTSAPNLATEFATSVDNYQTGFSALPDDPFTLLANEVDPSAFTVDPGVGLFPDNVIGDLAVGLDYTVFSSGLGVEGVDLFLDGLFNFDGAF